ncbi:MAG: hypothetical protein QOJ50_2990 [Cryptosporangiaceae bacterium]|nr:hypothetical protein [Cryptosporangiaceae bacterium]
MPNVRTMPNTRAATDANKWLVRAICAAADRGDPSAMGSLVDPAAVDHDPGTGAFEALTGGLGPIRTQLGPILADGDRVACARRIGSAAAISWLRMDEEERADTHWGLLAEPVRGGGAPPPRLGDGMVPRGSASSPEDNRAFMASAMEMLDAGEPGAFCSLVHEGCVTHARMPGREGIRRRLEEFLGAFDDAEFAVIDQLAEGDLVSGRYEFSARHTGPWHGRAPEGRVVSVTVMDMARIRDGQIVEYWVVTDTASLRRQLS